MKIIRTANLTILKAWLIGGQVDLNGCYSEGFYCLNSDLENSHLKINNKKFSYDLVKQEVILLLAAYSDEPSNGKNKSFKYYDENYKFNLPCVKNLNILVKRIIKELEKD